MGVEREEAEETGSGEGREGRRLGFHPLKMIYLRHRHHRRARWYEAG